MSVKIFDTHALTLMFCSTQKTKELMFCAAVPCESIPAAAAATAAAAAAAVAATAAAESIAAIAPYPTLVGAVLVLVVSHGSRKAQVGHLGRGALLFHLECPCLTIGLVIGGGMCRCTSSG